MGTSTYGEYKLTRKCSVAFELENKKGEQFLVTKNSNWHSYAIDYSIEGKNGEKASSLDSKFLSDIAAKEDSAENDCYRLFSWGYGANRLKANKEYVEEVFKDLETAKNDRYIGNYCIILLHEILNIGKRDGLKYLKILIPYLNKATGIAKSYLDDYINEVDHWNILNYKLRRQMLFALGVSSIAFRDVPDLEKKIKYEIMGALTEKDEALTYDLLLHFPINNEFGEDADYLFEKYGGVGMTHSFFVRYCIDKNKPEKLYSRLMERPCLIKDAFPNNTELDYYSPLETLRFLALHGYEKKIKEIAKALINISRNREDYLKLRVFFTDDEIIEIFKKNPAFGDDVDNGINALAITMDSKKVLLALNGKESFYLRNDIDYELTSYAYSYGENYLRQPEDYDIRNTRSFLRNHLQTGYFEDEDFNLALGLISYGDKAIKGYFTTEFVSKYQSDLLFAIIRGYAARKGSKMPKDMYVYKEGK